MASILTAAAAASAGRRLRLGNLNGYIAQNDSFQPSTDQNAKHSFFISKEKN
jgi:hypothetical protein